MDQDKLEVAIQNGIRARQLLESDAFKTTIQILKARYINQWENTGIEQRDIREALWFEYRCAMSIEVQLQQTVSNGKVAEKRLQEQLNG